MEAHLSSHHRDTIEKIFSHPTSRNIEWHQVVSLLERIGTVTHEHNGKLKVVLGPETELLPAPHGKDVDVQLVVDLRRMLKQAGYAPEGSPAVADRRQVTRRSHISAGSLRSNSPLATSAVCYVGSPHWPSP